MLRVLVFGMTENPGGVESFLMNYYRNIDRTAIQFDFLCNSYNPIAYEDEIHSLGGKTFHITSRSSNSIKYYKELKTFFANHSDEYKIIWVNVCSLANIDYLKLAKKAGIERRIIHSHNAENMDSKLRGLLHRHNKKTIDKYATDFWACSDKAARFFYSDNLLKRAVVIRNAIDIKLFAFNEESRASLRKTLGLENKYVIGNIGRLHFQKNQSFLLEVFQKVSLSCQEAELILVGDGQDKEILKQKSKALQIEDKVHFIGVTNDVSKFLSAFDLFLFPSLFEGLGISALEAEANGLPLLLSDTIAKELYLNSNVYCCELSKSADEWAKKVLEIRNSSKRKDPKSIMQNFINAGYNIETESKKLQQILEGDKFAAISD